MPPYRGLNRAELLRGVESMLFDTRPMANRRTNIQDIDDYQLPIAMMTFGPGSRLPTDIRHVAMENVPEVLSNYNQQRVTWDYLNNQRRLSGLRRMIADSWLKFKSAGREAYDKGIVNDPSDLEMNKIQAARIDEVGELIHGLMRKMEPYKEHVKNIRARTRSDLLLKYIIENRPLSYMKSSVKGSNVPRIIF